MIKATGYVNGHRIMMLGLSEENLTRLQAGKPIMFDATQLGYSGPVLIVYGATEAIIRRDLVTHGLAALQPDPHDGCSGCDCGACPGDTDDPPPPPLAPGRPTVMYVSPPVCPHCTHRHDDDGQCATHTWTDTCAYTAGADCPGPEVASGRTGSGKPGCGPT